VKARKCWLRTSNQSPRAAASAAVVLQPETIQLAQESAHKAWSSSLVIVA
jgi:hypothetical protein